MIQTNMFLQELHVFLRTLTIKNNDAAYQIRETAKAALGVDDLDDIYNPYYLHICGEYTDTDEMMYVTSLDTGETIEFTKANLATHLITKRAYQLPSDLFDKLCQEYPSQVDLIKSIVYPAISNNLLPYTDESIDQLRELIALPSYTLLSYGSDILHDNEEASLITAVRDYLQMVHDRWDIPEFTYQEYYVDAMWTITRYMLFVVLLLARINNLRTPQAHIDHIWYYLNSKGLADYREALTMEQQIFLYKNIDYLFAHRGTKSNLNILAEELLGRFHIALRPKSLLLASTDSLDNCLPTPTIISEDLDVHKTPLENSVAYTRTLEETFLQEFNDGVEPEYNDEVIAKQKKQLSYSPVTYLPTKLIDIEPAQLNGTHQPLYLRFLMQNLLRAVSDNKIHYIATVKPPGASDSITLSAKEALALAYYATLRSQTPSIILDAENAPWYYGCTIYHGGLIFTLSDTNAPQFLGEKVEIRASLAFIKLSAEMAEAFRDSIIVVGENEHVTLTEENEAVYIDTVVGKYVSYSLPTSCIMDSIYKYSFSPLPTTMLRETKEIPLSAYIDANKIVDNIPTRSSAYITASDWLKNVDAQFVEMKKHIQQTRNSSSRFFQDAWHVLYDALLVNEVKPIELMSDVVTYQDWFNKDPDLQSIIEVLDSNEDANAVYEEFGLALLKQLLAFDSANTTTNIGITAEQYYKLKSLMTELCSYRVVFLDRASSKKSYVVCGGMTARHLGDTSVRYGYLDIMYGCKTKAIGRRNGKCDMSIIVDATAKDINTRAGAMRLLPNIITTSHTTRKHYMTPVWKIVEAEKITTMTTSIGMCDFAAKS